MAADVYVVFANSDIKGDSRDEKHGKDNAVEVTSWSHSITQPKSATASSAGGHTSERCVHGEMMFGKLLDAASPKLWAASSAGTVIAKVEVFFYRALGGVDKVATKNERFEYLKITMNNVIISSVSPSLAGDDFPTESFGLTYSAIEWTYNELDVTGKPGKNKNIKGAWNLAKNTPSLA
jgi:type VI secretion system secreted protein Hcp